MGETGLKLTALLLSATLLGGCLTDREATIGGAMPTADSLSLAGDARRAGGDLAGAAALYRSAHETALEDTAPLLKLGRTLAAAGAYADSAEAFREVLILAPSNAEARRGLGNALVGLGQPGLALAHYHAANEESGGDWRAYLGLGAAHDLLGDPAAAAESYRDGLALAPDNPVLLNNLALSQALAEDMAPALATLERLNANAPRDARYRGTLAIAYALAGREADAARLMGESETPDAIARDLALLRAIRALDDHGRKALALKAVYSG